MLITKTTPQGIDWYIQELQTRLYDALMVKWSNPNYHSYGRCYRNKKDTGWIAEVFTGAEYKDVYWNDALDAISFFGMSEKIEYDKQNKANVHLVFFVNVKKLKPSITHRADEEIRADVQSIIGASLNGFFLESVELWLDNVLREYPGTRRDKGLIAVDMQPVHCFRLNFSISYDSQKNCTSIKLK